MLDKNKEKERRKQRKDKWNNSGCYPRVEPTKSEKAKKNKNKHKRKPEDDEYDR